MFDSLDRDAIRKIIDIELSGFFERIEAMGLKLKLSAEAVDFIADKGYDKNFGARPLKRAIQKYLEDDLAEMILQLNAEGKHGGTITAAYLDGSEKLTFAYVPESTVKELPAPESEVKPENQGEAETDDSKE